MKNWRARLAPTWAKASIPVYSIVLAFAVTILFIMLLTAHVVVAAIFAGIAGLVLAAWHVHEPADG